MTNGQIPWDAQSGEQPAAGMGQQQAPQDIQPAAPQQYGQPADQSFPQPPLPADPQYRQPVQQPGYAQPAEQSGYAAPAPQPGYAQPTQPVPAQVRQDTRTRSKTMHSSSITPNRPNPFPLRLRPPVTAHTGLLPPIMRRTRSNRR